MRRSRKGMRLNEAQFFDSSLRPLTKKIKKLRLFPQSSEETLPHENELEDVTKIRHNPQPLVRDQPSTEITRINYVDVEKIPIIKPENDEGRQDISIQICSSDFLEASPSVSTVDGENEQCLIISDEVSIINSFRLEEIGEDPASVMSKSPQEDEELPEKISQVRENGSNVSQVVENNFLKTEASKREDKSWWRIIMDFLGIFWWKREDKRGSRNRTKKSVGRTLLTENKENTRIKQIYISSLERDVQEKKRARSLKPFERRGDNEFQNYEKLKIRQMSSPLY